MATTETTPPEYDGTGYERSGTASREPAGRRRLWPRVLLVLVLVLASVAAVAWFSNRTTINGYAMTGASYAARVGCSCRYIGGRSISDCAKDKVPGMELVRLTEDPANKSVTATFPLVASQTATYREGYGCVLEEWPE